jgi:hypothetical protein
MNSCSTTLFWVVTAVRQLATYLLSRLNYLPPFEVWSPSNLPEFAHMLQINLWAVLNFLPLKDNNFAVDILSKTTGQRNISAKLQFHKSENTKRMVSQKHFSDRLSWTVLFLLQRLFLHSQRSTWRPRYNWTFSPINNTLIQFEKQELSSYNSIHACFIPQAIKLFLFTHTLKLSRT